MAEYLQLETIQRQECEILGEPAPNIRERDPVLCNVDLITSRNEPLLLEGTFLVTASVPIAPKQL
jgi:hypothetical protein